MTEQSQIGRPIRVLHLRDSPWVDGPGRTIIESGAHFDPDRIEFHIGVLVSSANSPHPMIDVAKHRGLAVHPIIDQGGSDFGAVKSILAIVDSLQVDILHTSDLRTRLLGLLVCHGRRRLRAVTTAHGWIANTTRRRVLKLFDKILLRYFDNVVVVSSAMRDLVPRWWLPDNRVSVLRNALVLDSYGKEVLSRKRRKYGRETKVNLLNVGRLSPEKGQDLLLQAVALLSPEYPALRLHIAGVGPMELRLRALTTKLGIESIVSFLGFVEDMPTLYSEADLLVQSSLTEGLPNVILEAAYLGIPILATDVGGTREVVVPDRHASLISAGSVEALSEGIRQYLRNPTKSIRMAQAAHRRILAEFSFDARTEQMTRIYEKLARLGQSDNST